jgi:aminopeptidase N
MQKVPRLSHDFQPSYYNISLNIDRIGRKFTGTVTIQGLQLSENNYIALHAKHLEINAIVMDGKAAEFKLIDDELQIYHKDIVPGRHIIVVTYVGTITDPMHGLYPCYFEENGTKHELLATQFESHHAREVFPCIDEPSAKATFDLTLTTEDNVTVLGNMPIKNQLNDGGMLVTTFDTTPKMSTYLLAFIIGELEKTTSRTKRGVEVNVWSTKAQSATSRDFALDIAVRTIEFYEEFFGINYPLPKSDHVALPDFTSGAMENWGLITYREIALLADSSTSIGSRQYIATVVAHELAHQWFGNLVTMEWWNDLWLNESFATLMEYVAIDHLHPEWEMWLEFATNESILALRRDSTDGVQSVQTDVNHPDEINSIFDGSIVYAKGARLLNMLRHYVGQADFQSGLKQYFIDFAYKNTVGNDLWQAIETASGKPVQQLMNTWISQPGYPVVNIQNDNDKVILSQSQFFVGPHTNHQRTWPIPLDSNITDAPLLMTDEVLTITAPSHAIKINVANASHFITNYDKLSRDAIIEEIRSGKASQILKIQFLNETTLLARGGIMPSSELVTILDAYRNETSEQVWAIMFVALAELRKFVENDNETEKKLRNFSAEIAASQYTRLGWQQQDGESEDDTKLRSTILSLTLYGESESAIATASEIYKSNKLKDINAEIRPLIISSAVRHGEPSLVDDLMNIYKSSPSGDLRQDICLGVTSTRDNSKINQLLESIKDNSVVRPQDAAYWFVYLIRGRESRQQTWQWVQTNWQWIEKTFGSDKSYDAFPRYTASALTTKQQLDEFTKFFTPMLSELALQRVIEMGITEIEGRVELILRDSPGVKRVLDNL